MPMNNCGLQNDSKPSALFIQQKLRIFRAGYHSIFDPSHKEWKHKNLYGYKETKESVDADDQIDDITYDSFSETQGRNIRIPVAKQNLEKYDAKVVYRTMDTTIFLVDSGHGI